jgi:hypothetical protein
MLSPFIRAKRVYMADARELKDLVSQKRQSPRKTKPMKKGRIPIMALMTTGRATAKVRFMKVYYETLSM